MTETGKAVLSEAEKAELGAVRPGDLFVREWDGRRGLCMAVRPDHMIMTMWNDGGPVLGASLAITPKTYQMIPGTLAPTALLKEIRSLLANPEQQALQAPAGAAGQSRLDFALDELDKYLNQAFDPLNTPPRQPPTDYGTEER